MKNINQVIELFLERNALVLEDVLNVKTQQYLYC
jgi:hypothetical protein